MGFLLSIIATQIGQLNMVSTVAKSLFQIVMNEKNKRVIINYGLPNSVQQMLNDNAV